MTNRTDSLIRYANHYDAAADALFDLLLLSDDELAECDHLETARNYDCSPGFIARILDLDTDSMTALRYAYEICPIHRCDDAICADDNITECAHLR